MSEIDTLGFSVREPKINGHVARLNRFLPLSASHDQIYEEYQSGDDGLTLETEAMAYTLNAIRSDARCIVLTGDAGHGKTHLCRRLLEEHLGHDLKSSRRLLLECCDGEHEIDHAVHPETVRKLRIHKDFSEIDPDVAAQFIERLGEGAEGTLVICANEGRLRAVINSSRAGAVCQQLLRTFQQSFRTGLASVDGNIHIVNLNFQSVAAAGKSEKGSLLHRTLQSWAKDGKRWVQSCGNCSLADRCPIKRNRDLLGGEGELSETRLEKLERLCSTVERLGYVITIREMLMLIAYLMTGGLVCDDVRRLLVKSPDAGWQHAYAYYNLLFDRPDSVPEDRLFKGIPILSVLPRLDPGRIARRVVDDRLLNEGDVFPVGQLDLQFDVQAGSRRKTIDASSGIDEVIGTPQSRNDLAREADSVRRVVSALRRRSFFDDQDSAGDMLKRLGFRHGDDFLTILEEKLTPQLRVRMKNLVVAGLHGIQGLRMSATETTLFLVNPAFGRASADAAIIARRIPAQEIQIVSSGAAWNAGGKSWTLPESVNWIDRSVVVRIDEPNAETSELALDLLSFECVARSASGHISEDFYAQEMRRVRTFLGKIAERGRTQDGQISLFLNGKVHTVSLDEGVIQVGGGGA